MQPARRSRDVPPEPEPDLPGLIAGVRETSRRADACIAAVEQVVEAARNGRPLPDGTDRRQLALAVHGLRHAGGEMRGFTDQAAILAARTALSDTARELARDTGFREGVSAAAGRHRAPRRRRPGRGQLALIPGEGAVVSGVAAGVAFLRHSAAAKATVGAAAAVTLATVSTSGFTTIPDVMNTTPSHSTATSLPVLDPQSAIPIMLPPSPPSTGRHAKPGAPDAATASPLAAPVVTLAPSSAPATSSQPSAPVGGTLDVQTVNVSIGLGGTGMLTFSAVGAALEWHASSSSPALSLDRSGGILGGGQSCTIGLHVAPGSLAGSASVTITARGQSEQVRVVWVSVPGLGL